MEELTLSPEALSSAKKNLIDYFNTLDLKYVAEDAVYRNLNTGQVHRGKTEVGAMLHYVYRVAFNARIERTNLVVEGNKAVLEGYFTGKHIGEFMGIPATNREVRVPLSVSYELKDGLISEARIYMVSDEMRQQLGVSVPGRRTTFVVRDTFQLKFGKFREAKILLEKALENKLMPDTDHRVFTDFTGESYRLIFEEGFENLGEFEVSLTSSMKTEEWQQWYELFKPLVERSSREILKQMV